MKVSCLISLLDVKKGIVVLTKCDLVDDEWLENAPFVPVSSTTGKGLDKLVAELDNLAGHDFWHSEGGRRGSCLSQDA